MKGWHDGELVEVQELQVPVLDRGLQFGEGLYETMLAQEASVPLLSKHLDRFERSCNELDLPFPGRSVLKNAVQNVIDANAGADQAEESSRLIVKLLMTGGSGNGLYRSAAPDPNFFLLPRPFSNRVTEWKENGGTCQFVPVRGNTGSPLARIKTISRLGETLALERGREKGSEAFREMLFVSEDRHLLQGARTNVFLRLEDGWFTPPVTDGLLPGVARRVLLEAAVLETIEERLLFTADIQSARHMVVTNAVTGPVPIRELIAPSLRYTEQSPRTMELPPDEYVLSNVWENALNG